MNNKGFTLIELLAIIAMVSILSSLVFFDYNVSNKYFALERSSQKIAQDIRIAQQKSLIGLEGNSGTNGYGVYFSLSSKNNYIIYENNNSTPYYDFGDTISQTIEIEKGIEIDSLSSNGNYTDSISISFFPPGPITYIQNNFLNTEALISLTVSESVGKKRIIRINSSGASEIFDPFNL